MAPVEHALVTPGLELAGVGLRRGVAEDGREVDGDEHVVVLLLEDLHRTGEAVAEEAEVETQVVVLDPLPGTGRGGEGTVGADGGEEAAADEGAGGSRRVVQLHAVVVGDAALVTDLAVGGAELELVEPLDILQERFLGDAPSEGAAPEEGPAVLRQELGGAVVTGLEFHEIAGLVVVVGAAEEGGHGELPAVRAHQGDVTRAVHDLETGLDVLRVGAEVAVVLELVLGTEGEAGVVRVGEALVGVQVSRCGIEVGPGSRLLVVAVGGRRVEGEHLRARVVIVFDRVVVLVAHGRVGVVTEVHVGVEPGGQAELQRLAEREGGDGQLVVAAELGLGGRGVPGTPAIGLAILGEERKTRHRDGRGKEGAHIHRGDLVLAVVADGGIDREPGSDLERVVQAEVVALVVVPTVLERGAVIGIAQG